ncbi:dioxygenase [Mycobacteroides saopaulense]|uniref:Dioxygenase n=1 Tax=Mycobacteroides saopaulense TaxID=1578165 RepID=A0A1X0IVU2_9MYCO|nr:carotenoid oxygenase family protein [Mycobacteroides saopaulense]ORB52708.1 dioxygenase [Mycobacteroides saopaulense]
MTLAPEHSTAESGFDDLISRPFESQLREFDYEVTHVDGKLPEGLTGTLFRIGPGKFEVGTTVLRTMFDADGMVSRFVLDGSSVRFTNRYVRTEQFRDGLQNAPMRRRGITTNVPRKLFANLRPPANTANTNIVPLAGEMLALWEGGPPHRLDPDTLETLGTHDFDGRLGYVGAFSAHPKWDPVTGEMFNFGVDVFPTPRLRCYRVGTDGKLSQINSVTLWDMGWNHDFALTEKYLVFVLDPIRPNIGQLLRGKRFDESLEYQLTNGSTKFILVPRDGSKPLVFEHDPQLHIHVTNAFQDGPDAVVEFVRYESLNFLRRSLTAALKPAPHSNPHHHLVIRQWPDSHLVRFRISPAGRITEEVVSQSAKIEFPQYDWRQSTRNHQITYCAGTLAHDGHYNGIFKFDHRAGAMTHCGFGTASVCEPIFVPRDKGTAQDDGWLLAVNHDLVENRSQLVILDARDLERGPLAVAHLTHHLPIGFHGTFTRRVADPSAPLPHPALLP